MPVHSKVGVLSSILGDSCAYPFAEPSMSNMTRDEALSLYRPIRAGIQRVLKLAVSGCNRSDWMRASKHLSVWSEDEVAIEDNNIVDMITDIALFEPNQRKRRAYDAFLADQAQQLDPADLQLATLMADAFFSIFKVVGRHPAAGIWVENVLDRNRRIWVLDEGLESSAPDSFVFGMRLFDVGPFHAGFGIVVPADEETTYFCAEARARGGPLPVRGSLAATLYGDAMWSDAPLGEAEVEMLSGLLDILAKSSSSRKKVKPKPQVRTKRRRHS
jgi:hypothetical protein